MLGCEVIVSTAAIEADEETVKIARARGAFAILGQDSDYLMYETGDVAYLSLKHFGKYYLIIFIRALFLSWACFLDLATLTTYCYDRVEFANYLGILPPQLPLFAVSMLTWVGKIIC